MVGIVRALQQFKQHSVSSRSSTCRLIVRALLLAAESVRAIQNYKQYIAHSSSRRTKKASGRTELGLYIRLTIRPSACPKYIYELENPRMISARILLFHVVSA